MVIGLPELALHGSLVCRLGLLEELASCEKLVPRRETACWVYQASCAWFLVEIPSLLSALQAWRSRLCNGPLSQHCGRL